jgi:hypothetical protein
MDDERRYIDPLRCIYFDEDGDVHYDCSRIAEIFHCTLEEAMEVAESIAAEQGIATERLYAPKPRRGN